MFIMDCDSKVLMAPPILAKNLWLKNQLFTFSTSSVKPPAVHIMPEDFLDLAHHNLVKF